MRAQRSYTSVFTFVLVVSLCVGASAQDNAPPQGYSGVAVGTGGSVRGRTIGFDFRIVHNRRGSSELCVTGEG
jgi:hypothetical protein